MKHLSTTNQCPLTGQPLTQSDLLDLNTAQATPPNLTTQVPHILQSAAACFDQLQLEKLRMQEALLQTRKELSHALYQHDAACHVIARLQQENQALVHRLSSSDQRAEELSQRVKLQQQHIEKQTEHQSQMEAQAHA